MSITNNSQAATTTTTFGRNSSYPTSINSNNQSSGLFNGKRCLSITILPSSIDSSSYSKINSINSQTLDRQIELNLTGNSSWIERYKQRVTNIFKRISKPTMKQGK
jgi:hypothetical protein